MKIKPKLIIDNGGQTCNKFWCYLPAFIEGIRNNTTAYSLLYDIEMFNYPNIIKNRNIRFPFFLKYIKSEKLFKLIYRYYYALYNNKLYNCLPYIRKICDNPWENRHIIITSKEHSLISHIFQPSKTIRNEVDAEFISTSELNTITIGIHIRRGDYKIWCGGKYYYSLQTYVQICKKITTQLKGNNHIRFLLCSNEDIPLELFNEFKILSLRNPSPTKDLYALSRCDYILGPPSSFSMWASFIGKVPLCYITDPDQSTYRFSIIKACDQFENGEKLNLE